MPACSSRRKCPSPLGSRAAAFFRRGGGRRPDALVDQQLHAALVGRVTNRERLAERLKGRRGQSTHGEAVRVVPFPPGIALAAHRVEVHRVEARRLLPIQCFPQRQQIVLHVPRPALRCRRRDIRPGAERVTVGAPDPGAHRPQCGFQQTPARLRHRQAPDAQRVDPRDPGTTQGRRAVRQSRQDHQHRDVALGVEIFDQIQRQRVRPLLGEVLDLVDEDRRGRRRSPRPVRRRERGWPRRSAPVGGARVCSSTTSPAITPGNAATHRPGGRPRGAVVVGGGARDAVGEVAVERLDPRTVRNPRLDERGEPQSLQPPGGLAHQHALARARRALKQQRATRVEGLSVEQRLGASGDLRELALSSDEHQGVGGLPGMGETGQRPAQRGRRAAAPRRAPST